MSFKVGDRVQIPEGTEGTVKYVGKVSFAKGNHVGVELDTPAGDNDGKKKGKRYFQCKKKHGKIEKAAYFSPASKKKKGKRKSITGKSKKSGRSSKAPKNLAPITDDPEDDDDEKDEPKPKGKKGKGASPAPAVQTTTIGIQTDAPKEMLKYVESEYYCKVITRLANEENEKLRKQRDEAIAQTISLQQRTDAAEAQAKQLEYEIKQQSVELDPLREQLEMKEVELEEMTIKLEIANIEIEELNEKLEESLDQYVEQIAADNKEHAEVLKMNQELQQQLQSLVRVGQELIDSKDKHINSLATESNYVDSLSARLKDLLSVEQEVLGLKTKVKELEDQNNVLQDADRLNRTLTEYNNELEGELTDWREWVLDVEAERKILEELHENDDKHIIDLTKEKKDLEVQLVAIDKENKQLKIEKQDLQKEIFELRNKMERQDISAANEYQKYNFAPTTSTAVNNNTAGGGNPTDDEPNGDYVMIGNNPTDDQPLMNGGTGAGGGGGGSGNNKQLLDNSSDKKLEAIWNENIKLQTQVEQMRGIVMSQINETVKGQASYVQYELMKQYLPAHSQDVDYRGIAVLALLQQILYKAKAARDLLERFYNDPSSATMKNPALSTMSHALCPLILSQENYIRAIQKGYLSIDTEDVEGWKQKALKFETSKFKRILESYDELLKAIENAGKTHELSFEIDKLADHEKVLKAFIEKHFVEFSPDRPKKDEYRCSKNTVLQHMSETHYRFQSLSIKLNQFNAKLFDLVHAPAQTTKRITSVAADDDNKYDENNQEEQPEIPTGDYEETIEDVLKILKIGAVEKIFRLRNDVLAATQQILQYCQPVELGYGKQKYSANLLKDANRTSIQWGKLKASKHISFKAVQRVGKMLEAINEKVKIYQIPRKRVTNINKIIEEEEEQNDEGLITILEKAYDIVADVRKIIGSTLYTTEKTTDDMAAHTYDEFKVPYWENNAAKFRVLFEKQRENQDKIKNQEESIKVSNTKVAEVEKAMKEKESVILILKEQCVKEKEKSTNLAAIQKENTDLSAKNEKFKTQIMNMTQKISRQEEEIANKSASIEKYKKAIQRIKDKDNPIGPKPRDTHDASNKTLTNLPNGVMKTAAGPNVRHGTLLVDREVEYSSLLQQTIQSLRRRVTELTMNRKLENCALKLKPLPFTLLRDKVISNLNEEVNKKVEKKKKRVKKSKPKEEIVKEQIDKPEAKTEDGADEADENKDEENKKEEKEEEEEYEWVTDDEDDSENIRQQKMAELMKLKREKEMTEKMQSELGELSASLDNIRSQPLIVDLTKKKRRNDDLSQEIIGRQMQLRDVHIQCQQMKNEITKQVEEQNRESQDGNNTENQPETRKDLGQVLGSVEIPNSSLKSLGYDRTHRVMLPSQQFDKLQTSFLW